MATQLISTADIAWMRGVQLQAQPGTAVIQRRSDTSDGMGGYTESWAAIGTVTARIMPVSPTQREFVTGSQITSVAKWYITVPGTATVRADDRIVIGSRVYEVTFVPNDQDYRTALHIECVSLNEETT